jgi:hypothetical protein
MSISLRQLKSNADNGAGIGAKVIVRGNPTRTSLLALTSFQEVHLYQATSVGSLDIATTMEEDAVYEVLYAAISTSGSTNADPSLFPNFTSYPNEFATNYLYTSSSSAGAAPYWYNQGAIAHVYFDHFGGGEGANPCGRWTIFNCRGTKMIKYQGADTRSACIGTCRWNNSTTQWSSIGELRYFTTAAMITAWVRRIA